VLVIAAVLLSPASASSQISSVLIDRDRITISVPIDVIGGNARLVRDWRRAIDRAWNQGNDGKRFRVCGRQVTFVPDFQPRQVLTARGAHLLFIEPASPHRRIVSSVWHIDASPTLKPRTAIWASDLAPAVVAHEFGHLLGLLDEYTGADDNGNGAQDPGEGSIPDVARYPDGWMSLMAFERGAVLERHVREAMARHGAADALECAHAGSH
jgi:hypothetical protein